MAAQPGRWAGARARADRLAKRAHAEREHHASIDTAFQMVERDGDTGGGIIAGALAYRFFIWLLPLTLVLVAGLGFAADAVSKSPEEAASSFGLAGLVSTSVASAAEGSGRWYALLVGIPVLVYVTRGLLRALIGVHRLVWGESRSTVAKPRIGATLIFLVYLLGGLLATGLANWARATSGGLAAAGVIGALLAYGLLWVMVTLRLPHRDAPWRALLPGAAAFALGLTAMHALTAFFLVPYVLNKGGTYGALGIAAGLLFGLYLLSRLMVYAAVVNATLWERGAVIGGK